MRRAHHNENHTRKLKRNMFDITNLEIVSSKQRFNQVVDGHEFGGREIDSDYAWLLGFLTDTNEQPVSSVEEVITEDEKEDTGDMDPQYSIFLRELTEKGKSYKLKISINDEPLKFLEYEELEKSDGDDLPTYAIVSTGGNSGDKVKSSEDMRDRQKSLTTKQISRKKKIKKHKVKSSGDMRRDRQINQKLKRSLHGRKGETLTTKEISRKKKIKEHKSITEPSHDVSVDSCYRMLLDGCIRSEYGTFVYEGTQVNYEEKPASSDSDVLILDNLQDCSEVNNKQLTTAEKDISLKEKLMRILRQPYDRGEHERLSEYVEEQKPIRRTLTLRGRAIASAYDGPTTSVLDNVPTTFRRKLEAAQNERPRALNLLRMFCFWLEHVPNEDIFYPWLDEDCLKVRPSTRRC